MWRRGEAARGRRRQGIKPHKGGPRRARHGGRGSRPAAGAAAAAVLWEAAGDAVAWTASMREHAAWTEASRGWAYRIESDESIKRAARECGDAIDARDVVLDEDMMARAIETLRRAVPTLERAAESFGRSTGLHREAEDGQNRAADAYRRAYLQWRAEAAGRSAKEMNRHAQTAAKLMSGMLGGSKELECEAARMERHAAAISKAGRHSQGRNMDELSSIQADLWDNALMARAESAELARRSAEIGRLTAEVRGMAEATAKRSAARAGREAARSRDGGPDMQEAAAAWKRAMEDAKRMEEGMSERR